MVHGSHRWTEGKRERRENMKSFFHISKTISYTVKKLGKKNVTEMPKLTINITSEIYRV